MYVRVYSVCVTVHTSTAGGVITERVSSSTRVTHGLASHRADVGTVVTVGKRQCAALCIINRNHQE